MIKGVKNWITGKDRALTDKQRKRRKRLIVLGVILGAFLLGSVLAVEMTSHSGFCSSCHFMKPYFASWEESSHAEFECSVCHYPPGGGIRSKLSKKIEGLVMVGRYWTKLYVKSKPWAEIKDESCLREGCHEKRLLEGQVKFKSVVFDHSIHFDDLKRGKNLQCTSCHSQIVQGEHITVTESSCFICHFKESEHYPKISECNHCHTQETLTAQESRFNHEVVFDNGFTCVKCHSNTILGDGEVPRENCYKCHMERERLDEYENTDLMHSAHISDSKIECNQCHMDIQHKILKDPETIADCQTCHTDFHEAQKILYTGVGGRGVDHPVPNVMLEKGLSCKGCHMFHEVKGTGTFRKETFVSDAEACESCHGKGYARLLKDWEASTVKKVRQVRAIYDRARQEIGRSRDSRKEEALKLLEDALFNIEVVDKGKSVHNVAFSQELLKAAYSNIKEALAAVESRYTPAEFVAVPENIPTQCSTCHAGIEEIGGSVFGMRFSHDGHLIKLGLDCDTCHSNVRKHGEFIATKETCASCHHDETERECVSCHTVQGAFYNGGRLDGIEVPRDIMSEAEVECETCHTGVNETIIRPGRSVCVACHDEDYGGMFDEWQDSIKDLVKSLQTKIREKRGLKLSADLKKTISGIERHLGLIIWDGSSGIHNYMFFEEFLGSLIKRIDAMGPLGH